MSDVRTQIDAIDDLPVRSEPPVVQMLGTTEPVVSVAIHGPVTYPELKDLAELTRSELQRIDGVSRLVMEGFTDRQLRIELDALTLEGLGLSVVEMANLIRVLNVDVPAGDINTAGGTVSLRVEDERKSPAELVNLKFRSPLGDQDIRLGDIATITDTFEYPNQRIEFDGQPGVLLRIEKIDRMMP
jgi:HAE1 family hydrophobic/amphiphilic exporter-1